jgi:hypothetical protein
VVDIFDEVSDDLRTERAIALARRYGGLLVLLLVLVLLGVGAQQAWRWHQAQRNDKAATEFLALTGPIDQAGPNLTDPQRVQDGQSLTAFAASAPDGYKTLANFRAAALYNDAGQPARAEALWTEIGHDGSADPLLRGLANLLWAEHALGTAPDAEVLARLKPLAALGTPYHGLAQETQALVYLHEGNTGLAKALFSQIASDPATPEGVRNRANGLLAQLNG